LRKQSAFWAITLSITPAERPSGKLNHPSIRNLCEGFVV
jgi:hypothetical protein